MSWEQGRLCNLESEMGIRDSKQAALANRPSTNARIAAFFWVTGVAIAGLAGFSVWTMWANAQDNPTARFGYEVVKAYPHDVEAFTQGLVFEGGELYEGTGHEGSSTLRKVDLASGEVLESRPLGARLFGEGITILGDKLYQLTWKNGVCLVYDKATLRQTGTLRFRGEGWGLTNDGTHLIMSNGSSVLQFLDPKTFRVVRRLNITEGGVRVEHLNELEYVDGQIYANRWYWDYVYVISPRTGEVTAKIDLSGLLVRENREHVLNGIAYDEESGRLFVTGKHWPKLFEIRVVPKK
jgi:glutamine cyclotransferase